MAMQTGVTFSKVLLLGAAGSILIRNGKMSDILGELQEMAKAFERSNDNGVGTDADLSEVLASQVKRLTSEIRQLASSHPVVFTGSSSQTGITSLVVPVAAIGALSYGYMWLKGISISDLMYVTKRNMAHAVSSMSKHFEQVSAALAATKKHLTQRIENLDDKLDEQKAISNVIRKEVSDSNKLIENLGLDLSFIQQLVSNMDNKVDAMVDKENLSLTGVMYLCRLMDGKGGKVPDSLQDTSPTRMLAGKTFLDHFDTSYLKGLQHIVEETENLNLAISRGVSLPRATSIKFQ